MEVAKDEAALRGLTRAWFKRSTAFSVLKEAAAAGHQVIMTTDHGSILCQRPATVFARRDATSNLRYKFGQDLRPEKPENGFFHPSERGSSFPRWKAGCNVRGGCRRLLLRLSYQVEGIPAPVPQLVPARGHLPRGDGRPDCAPHPAFSRLRTLTGRRDALHSGPLVPPSHLTALAAAGAATFAFAALDASAYVLLIPFVDALFSAPPTGGSGAGQADPMSRLLDATVYRVVDVQGDALQAVQGIIVLILVVFLLKNVFDFAPDLSGGVGGAVRDEGFAERGLRPRPTARPFVLRPDTGRTDHLPAHPRRGADASPAYDGVGEASLLRFEFAVAVAFMLCCHGSSHLRPS